MASGIDWSSLPASAPFPGHLSPLDLSQALKTAFGNPGPALAFSGVLATLQRGVRSACIGLVGDSTGDDKLQAGPASEEWPRVLIRALGADFPAYTVQERNWNDAIQGYDAPVTLQNGTGNGGGTRRAVFARATPGQLVYNAAAITGDLEIRARIAPNAWAAPGGGTILARWESTGNQRAVLLLLNADGTLGLNWSTDGTTSVGQKNSTASMTSVPGVANGQPWHIRVRLDVDNGASGNTLTFDTSPDGTTWTALGSPVVTAGVTSIFASTANWMVGSFSAGFSTPFDGSVYAVSIRTSIGSQTSIVPPLLDDWDYTSAETTVSFAGAPVLTLLNGSQSGQNVSYFDNATRRAVIHQRHGQAVVIISTSHNDGLQSRQTWLSNYNAMVGNIKSALPYVPILVVSQNPPGLGGAYNITAQGRELRLSRQAILQQYAAATAGVYAFDAGPLLTPADTIDQLHPSAGEGSGHDKWGKGLYRRVTSFLA